jgi:hypothetical protein
MGLISGCSRAAEPALRVGEVTFDEGSLRGLSADQRALLASVTVLQEALGSPEGITRAGAIHEEAWTRQRRIERLREETVLRAAGVSEEDLEARYQRNPSLELEVRHLVLLAEPWQSSDVRAAARRGAHQALEEIQRGDPFEAVVARWSEEPGAAARGGRLSPGREGTWVRPFWEAALALREGQVSPVVETPFGFHVLRLEHRRTLPYTEDRPRVVREVAAQLGGGAAWEEVRQSMRAGIEIVDATKAAYPVLESLWMLLPPTNDDPVGSGSVDQPAVLARWAGGELTTLDFLKDLRGLTTREVLGAGSNPEQMRVLLIEAAEQRRLEQMADELRLQVPPEDVVAEMQRWSQIALEWVAALGLEPGGSPTARAERALSALRRTGQNAGIARDEIREVAPALMSALPMQWKPESLP